MKIFRRFYTTFIVCYSAFITNALASEPCIDPTTSPGTMECLIGRDAAFIQSLIISAIEQTPVNETARVDLPINPRTGTNDWNFIGRGIGIAIPRSNFVFNGRDPITGKNARFHIDVNGGGNLGAIVSIVGLQQNQHTFIGFSKDKTYLFPKTGSPASAVAVKFDWYTNPNYYPGNPALAYDPPIVVVKSISEGNTSLGIDMMVENVTVKNITIEHVHIENSAGLNSVSIEHADNVTIDNINVINSPQTSFGVVSTGYLDFTPEIPAIPATATTPAVPLVPSKPAVPAHPVTKVVLRNCSSINSHNEAFRVIFYGNGTPKISASIEGSTAVNSGPTFDANQMPFTANRKIHVYYRAWGNQSSLSINNSDFDSSAEVGALSTSPNLSITNSVISGGITLLGDAAPSPISASIVGNRFNCYYAKSGSNESCVYIKNTPYVSLKNNRISGNRNAWYSSDTPITDKCNYWLNADLTPYYYSLSTGTNQTCP